METIANNKERYFEYILSSVRECDLCERMCTRKKVLSKYNGSISTKVLFVAEAPGRLGAECTGIPLYGDTTGNNFEVLLGNIGWHRDDVFITNAVLCNPQDENGNNSTPTKIEIQNCNYYLDMVIELINPEVIVTIGTKALEALKNIEDHHISLKENVATLVPWRGTNIFPLYHMSPRAAIHRSISKQRADFITLSHIVDPQKGMKHNRNPVVGNNEKKINHRLVEIVKVIMSEMIEVSYFKLTKLLFLIDYHHLKDFGTSLSGSIYLRMQEGPWIPYLVELSKEYQNVLFRTTFIKKKPILYSLISILVTDLSESEVKYIVSQIDKYRLANDSQMKTYAYSTEPMKYILRQEKLGRQMTKTPVLYKDSTILDVEKKNNED